MRSESESDVEELDEQELERLRKDVLGRGDDA